MIYLFCLIDLYKWNPFQFGTTKQICHSHTLNGAIVLSILETFKEKWSQKHTSQLVSVSSRNCSLCKTLLPDYTMVRIQIPKRKWNLSAGNKHFRQREQKQFYLSFCFIFNVIRLVLSMEEKKFPFFCERVSVQIAALKCVIYVKRHHAIYLETIMCYDVPFPKKQKKKNKRERNACFAFFWWHNENI